MKKTLIFVAFVLAAVTLALANGEPRHEDPALSAPGLFAVARSAAAPVSPHQINHASQWSCLLPNGVIKLLIASGSLDMAVICHADS